MTKDTLRHWILVSVPNGDIVETVKQLELMNISGYEIGYKGSGETKDEVRVKFMGYDFQYKNVVKIFPQAVCGSMEVAICIKPERLIEVVGKLKENKIFNVEVQTSYFYEGDYRIVVFCDPTTLDFVMSLQN